MLKHKINDTEVNLALKALKTKLSNMTPVMEELGEIMVNSTKERFVKGVSPDGGAWAPKSQTTIDAYKKRGDRVDFRPLFGPSGALSQQIHYQATATSLEWGSSLIYAATQQYGASKGAFGTTSRGGAIPWGNIPARPFVGLSSGDGLAIVETIEDWLSGVED